MSGSHQEDRWQQFYWGLSEKKKLAADRDYPAARAQFVLDEQRISEGRAWLREYEASLLRSGASREVKAVR